MSYTENGGPLRDAARQRTTAVLFPAMMHLDQMEKRDQAQQWTFMAICDVLGERHGILPRVEELMSDPNTAHCTYGELVALALTEQQHPGGLTT